MSTPAALRGARAAVVFLTRVPLGGYPYTSADWRWASAWFPLVGAALGALGAGVFWLGRAAAGPTVGAALAVTAGLFVTGALHEDGLADTADALGGARDRERLLEILKDSRIGVFGAAALVMVLVLRVALLARLDRGAPAALVLAAAWSRAAPVWLMAALPYVTPVSSSRNRPLVDVRPLQAVAATAAAGLVSLAAAGVGLVSPPRALVAGPLCGAVAWLAARRFQARAGGITGDFLGATQQLCEVALLLYLATTWCI